MKILNAPTLQKKFDTLTGVSVVATGTYTGAATNLVSTAGANGSWRGENVAECSVTDISYNGALYFKYVTGAGQEHDWSDGDCVCVVVEIDNDQDDINIVSAGAHDAVVNRSVNRNFYIGLSETTGFSGAIRRTQASAVLNNAYKERYQAICLNKSDFLHRDSTGATVPMNDGDAFDWATVRRFDVVMYQLDVAATGASGNNPMSLKVHSVWTYDSATLVDKVPVVLTFDDQFDTCYSYAFQEAMKPRGLVGTILTTESNWGPGNNKFTQEQGNEMVQAGWDFVNHGSSHKDSDVETAGDMLIDQQAGWNELVSRGVRTNQVKTGGYPFGRVTQDYLDLLITDGYVFMRGTYQGHTAAVDAEGGQPSQYGHPILFGEPMSSVDWHKNSMPMNSQEADLNGADDHLAYLDYNRACGMASFHHGHGFAVSASDPLDMEQSEFDTFCAGLVTRMNPVDGLPPIEVVTLSRGSDSYLASMGIENLGDGGGRRRARRLRYSNKSRG